MLPPPQLGGLLVYSPSLNSEKDDPLLYSFPDQLNPSAARKWTATALGIRDFAAMMSPNPGKAGVKSLSTLKQRWIWYEPEPDFVIQAVIDLPRIRRVSQTPAHHTKDASSSSAATTTPHKTVYTYPTSSIDSAALLADLERAFALYSLLHGSFARTLEQEGKAGFGEAIKGWWDLWARSWKLDKSPGAAMDAQSTVPVARSSSKELQNQLAPLMKQFAATHSRSLSFLLDGRETLYLPSTSSTTSDSEKESTSSRPQLKDDAQLQSLLLYLCTLLPIPDPPTAPTKTAPPLPPKKKHGGSGGGAGGWGDSLTMGLFSTTGSHVGAVVPSAASMQSLNPVGLLPPISFPSFGGSTPPTTKEGEKSAEGGKKDAAAATAAVAVAKGGSGWTMRSLWAPFSGVSGSSSSSSLPLKEDAQSAASEAGAVEPVEVQETRDEDDGNGSDTSSIEQLRARTTSPKTASFTRKSSVSSGAAVADSDREGGGGTASGAAEALKAVGAKEGQVEAAATGPTGEEPDQEQLESRIEVAIDEALEPPPSLVQVQQQALVEEEETGRYAIVLADQTPGEVVWCSKGTLTLGLVLQLEMDKSERSWIIQKGRKLLEAVEAIMGATSTKSQKRPK